MTLKVRCTSVAIAEDTLTTTKFAIVKGQNIEGEIELRSYGYLFKAPWLVGNTYAMDLSTE